MSRYLHTLDHPEQVVNYCGRCRYYYADEDRSMCFSEAPDARTFVTPKDRACNNFQQYNLSSL